MFYLFKSVATLGVLTVQVKAGCSLWFDDLSSTKLPTVSHEMLSQRFLALEIALVVAKCSFCYSRRSCAEILARRFLQRVCATILPQRPLTEILYKDLS